MQKIEYFTEPFPHFVIDNFLTLKAAREILKECIDLKPFYEQAKVMGDTHLVPDNCDLCKSKQKTLRHMSRDNETLSLDSMFEKKRHKSPTLEFLEQAITSQTFFTVMDKADSIFPILNQVTTSESMISRYGKCDFYGWHQDNDIGDMREKRVITVSYYINKEPIKFKGGNLLLRYDDGVKIKEVIPKHNRAIIFPSNKIHAVEYVDLSGKAWDEGRFSIQYWLGFNNMYKFR